MPLNICIKCNNRISLLVVTTLKIISSLRDSLETLNELDDLRVLRVKLFRVHFQNQRKDVVGPEVHNGKVIAQEPLLALEHLSEAIKLRLKAFVELLVLDTLMFGNPEDVKYGPHAVSKDAFIGLDFDDVLWVGAAEVFPLGKLAD